MSYDAFISNIELLKGRTIKNVYYCSSSNECLIIVFSDNSYFHIYGRSSYEGDIELGWTERPDDYDKLEAGLITKEEYNEIKEYRARAEKERMDKAEYNNYLRLKEKYDNE